MVYHAVRAGAAGVGAGRNVFQNKDPTKMVRTLCGIVHEGLDWKEAIAKYRE
jgi:fructose-bisphosphate aldolase/2-amino-3,7-dideoxy-D-threo-hept-6-ulosonate synthase